MDWIWLKATWISRSMWRPHPRWQPGAWEKAHVCLFPFPRHPNPASWPYSSLPYPLAMWDWCEFISVLSPLSLLQSPQTHFTWLLCLHFMKHFTALKLICWGLTLLGVPFTSASVTLSRSLVEPIVRTWGVHRMCDNTNSSVTQRVVAYLRCNSLCI
jgi:hypothetical protein